MNAFHWIVESVFVLAGIFAFAVFGYLMTRPDLSGALLLQLIGTWAYITVWVIMARSEIPAGWSE